MLGLKENGSPQSMLDREKLFKVFRKKETGSPMLDRENFSKFSKGFQKERKKKLSRSALNRSFHHFQMQAVFFKASK